VASVDFASATRGAACVAMHEGVTERNVKSNANIIKHFVFYNFLCFGYTKGGHMFDSVRHALLHASSLALRYWLE